MKDPFGLKPLIHPSGVEGVLGLGQDEQTISMASCLIGNPRNSTNTDLICQAKEG